MDEKTIAKMTPAQQVAYYAHLLDELGFMTALEGNISVLDRQSGRLYCTPTGTRKRYITEETVSVLDFVTEEQISGKKVTSEYRLHKAAYLARPDVDAVVHCHPTYLTAYAVQDKPFVCLSNNLSLHVIDDGTIPCLPFGTAGTSHIADGLDEAIKDRPICLLGNHGVISVGKTIEEAFSYVESFEGAAKIDTIARLIGEPVDIKR